MSDLDKEITFEGKKITVRDYLKLALRYALVEEPPKRLMGDSDWLTLFHDQLAIVGIIPGGTVPCCKSYCDKNKPCHINAKASSKECDKALMSLINQL